jgi:hypothetical protein
MVMKAGSESINLFKGKCRDQWAGRCGICGPWQTSSMLLLLCVSDITYRVV